MKNTGFLDRITNRPLTGEDQLPIEEIPGGFFQDEYPPEPVETPAPQIPAAAPPAEQAPAELVQAPPPAAAPVQPPAPPEARRDRVLYLTQVDRDGDILRTRITRSLAASGSPLRDVLEALLQGPSAEERRQGIISLIPPETRLLSAVIRGTTAYISFSEDFQFNTYGVEGYAGQLRQVVWTVTEFPNVKDVQILIEGRRVDYLGEGIWIGGPVSRDSL